MIAIEDNNVELDMTKALEESRVDEAFVLDHIDSSTRTQTARGGGFGFRVIFSNGDTTVPARIDCKTLILVIEDLGCFFVYLYSCLARFYIVCTHSDIPDGSSTVLLSRCHHHRTMLSVLDRD